MTLAEEFKSRNFSKDSLEVEALAPSLTVNLQASTANGQYPPPHAHTTVQSWEASLLRRDTMPPRNSTFSSAMQQQMGAINRPRDGVCLTTRS